MYLKGNKIELREFTLDHLNNPRYFSWIRDLEVVISLYRIEYLLNTSFTEIETYIHNLLSSNTDCLFAIYDLTENEFIGTLKIGHIDWRSSVGDIGIMIGDKKMWGKGIAKEAIYLASKYAFEILSLRKLIGGGISSNVAICKCFESLGYQLEGISRKHILYKGNYEDLSTYSLFKEELISY